jgi:hypothetical protein
MAHALELVADCTVLKTHPLLTFQDGRYSYRIERRGEQSIYTVSDGQQTLTIPIAWAFGLGAAGQTYVFEKDGVFYQSRVSFYREINGLDLTMGAANKKPVDLHDAAGVAMDKAERTACFSCHSTGAVQNKTLTLDTLRPGVRCDHCHGPVEHHLQGVRQGDAKLAAMTRLKSLSTEQISNLCGQCHRTWEQVALMQVVGVLNVRFQPYRLTNSKCYDADDSRISCIACHDPHQEVDRVDSHYDAKCLACHAGGKPAARPCKVANQNCASCHMPKLDLPGAHHKFSDHQIRIVKANAPYPN